MEDNNFTCKTKYDMVNSMTRLNFLHYILSIIFMLLFKITQK